MALCIGHLGLFCWEVNWLNEIVMVSFKWVQTDSNASKIVSLTFGLQEKRVVSICGRVDQPSVYIRDWKTGQRVNRERIANATMNTVRPPP